MIKVSFMSSLTIKDVDIIHHQITFTLIYVKMHCTLTMEKCNIIGNKVLGLYPLIDTEKDSNFTLCDSNIISNSWYYNGYKFTESHVIKTNGHVIISGSHFKDNACPNITLRILNFNV